ncbi:MAG: 5'-methylthioadenosine/adenosylhomocysteine nucleosidase [bacterium]
MRANGLSFVVFCLIVLLCMSGCMGLSSRSVLEPIGIMGALDSELELIRDGMKLRSAKIISGRVYYEGQIEGHRVVVVKAGVGKVNAAMTAQVMIDRFGVGSVIFTGIAGGINPGLHIGDLVISSKLIQHDYGLISGDVLRPWKIAIGDSSGRDKPVSHFEPDSHLVALARRAAGRVDFPEPDTAISIHVVGPVKVYEGCIVTGDQFIASEKKRVWLQETFDACAVEMEGGAVAQVCATNGLPFVIIRTLSDLANEDARIDVEKFLSYAAHNSAALVLEMLKLLG